jgi:hypothetical protein
MTSKLIAATVLAFGAATIAMPSAASPTAVGSQATQTAPAAQRFAISPYDCYTDDGYGRKRPCSAGFKKKKKSS